MVSTGASKVFALAKKYAAAICLGGAAALILLHVWVALSASVNHSATFDEPGHLTSGRVYWENGDFRFDPENGNLAQRWAALPNWLAGDLPPRGPENAWHHSMLWPVAYSYLYQQGNALDAMLLRSRAMNLFWNVATAILVFGWSWRLFGKAGALVSLVFFCADPNFLAHGALATSDACAAFFLFAAVSAWWFHLRSASVWSGVLSSLVLGLACVAKFSAALLLPAFALLLLWALLGGAESRPRTAWMRRITISVVVHVAVSALVIWAFFDFRFSPRAEGTPAFDGYLIDWNILNGRTGLIGKAIMALRQLHALPEAYLYGFDNVVFGSAKRSAFAAGEFSDTGWWWFFPFAFLVKTPLATLLALVATLTAVMMRAVVLNRTERFAVKAWYSRWLVRVAPLLVLVMVVGAFALRTQLNIGHRHLLPLYPPLFVMIGALGVYARRHIVGFVGVSALVAGLSVASARIYPHPLAFFNALSGGPQNGWRNLVDSSLDWGQDLPGLANWLRAHPPATNEQVYLSYFGGDVPERFGIRPSVLPFVTPFKDPAPRYDFAPGVYCISATMLQRVYLGPSGAWNAQLELDYQKLRSLNLAASAWKNDPAKMAMLRKYMGPHSWPEIEGRLNELRFARLCHYLRVRRPDTEIGYSILIYRLTKAELEPVIDGTTAAFAAAMSNAATAASERD